jgi:hypothetical protein
MTSQFDFALLLPTVPLRMKHHIDWLRPIYQQVTVIPNIDPDDTEIYQTLAFNLTLKQLNAEGFSVQ